MKISKRAVAEMFENPRSAHFSKVNDLFAITTIVSIVAIVLETVPSLAVHHATFYTIELITATLFTIEYLIRLWFAKSARKYAFSFFGIVDFVAVLPTLIGLGNLTFLKSARVIRIIRFLRLVRLTKLSRLEVGDAEESMGIFTFNIALYAITLMSVMLILGVMLHVFIHTNGAYWSVPQGMFWAFSVFLGGLPAPIPPGTTGTVIFIIAKFCGMALFGLLVGVIGKVFDSLILGKR